MPASCCRTACAASSFVTSRLAWSLASAVVLAVSAVGTVQAATFGHARLLSGQAQPFQLQVPLRQLTQQDAQTLQVDIPPLAQWQAAGLAPPVALFSLNVNILPGPDAATRLLKVSSSEAFHGNSADLLLEVNTASGRQPYQISVLASRPLEVSAPAAPPSANVSGAGRQSGASAGSLKVKTGDTLWRIAQKNAVPGASIHQMLYALYQANPDAFINGNINQLKAGVQLRLPDTAAVQAVSRRQALQFFQQQMQAWQQGGSAGGATSSGLRASAPDSGAVQTSNTAPEPMPETAANASATGNPGSLSQDQLVLSSASPHATPGNASTEAVEADNALATQKNIAETDERISQLERNVKSVNEALQSQGQAATEAVLEGARSLGQSLAELAGDNAPEDGHAAATEGVNNNNTAQTNADKVASGLTSNLAPGQEASQGGRQQNGAVNGSSEAAVALAGKPMPEADHQAGQADGAVSSTSTQQTMQSGNWVQNNLLALVSAILALIVLIVVWVLRRANANNKQQPVTEAMVQQQLDKINLDLSQTGSSLNPPDPKQ